MGTPYEEAMLSMNNEPKTRYDELENQVNTVRGHILLEFMQKFMKYNVKQIDVKADFVVQMVPNDYEINGIAWVEEKGPLGFIVELKNTDGGEIMHETLHTLNTDDMLALLYWTTEALKETYDQEPEPEFVKVGDTGLHAKA